MKTRPIIFSGPMVRAILDGSKTQTRRVVKQANERVYGHVADAVAECPKGGWGAKWTDRPGGLDYDYRPSGHGFPCPYGVPGDRLWVRETHRIFAGYTPPSSMGSAMGVEYRADGSERIINGQDPADSPRLSMRWRPSIYMPRWASRITLEVTGVRVERVQEISEADCEAEGVASRLEPIQGRYNDLREQFDFLWDSINAKKPGCSWEDSPWVWVVEFRKVKP